ncbi:hypothetical protein AB0C04_09295, partial [Micromonospora sp. NPDC048909]|uniref:hypothetical protein n=1 Tax=Micromonospora sp. NPDC048909 TaxID=3155643 RepID=UPI0034069E9C
MVPVPHYPRGGRRKRGRSCWCQRAWQPGAASRAGHRVATSFPPAWHRGPPPPYRPQVTDALLTRGIAGVTNTAGGDTALTRPAVEERLRRLGQRLARAGTEPAPIPT